MKIKQPIQMATIFEYFAQQNTLKRPKGELIEQMKDLVVLTNFLLNRIPTVMKTLKQSVRDQQKCMKQGAQNLRKSMNTVMTARTKQCFYLQSAYKSLCSFPNINTYKLTYAVSSHLQYKLKFFQSQNLPSDFIWAKPVRAFNQLRRSTIKKKQKDYSLHSIFNPRLSMMEIMTKKYRILVRLDVENKEYVWRIDRIELKVNQDPANWAVSYFNLKVLGHIKEKFQEQAQFNFLSCVEKFSHCLELIELNLSLSQMQYLKDFTQNLTLKHKNLTLNLSFTTPQSFEPPTVTITPVNFPLPSSFPSLSLILTYTKRSIHLALHIGDNFSLHSVDNFKYQSPQILLSYCETLLQYGKRYLQFLSLYSNDQEGLKRYRSEQIGKFVYLRVGGVYWASDTAEGGTGMCKAVWEDGIYIGAVLMNGYFCCSIGANGRLNSKLISRSFLQKLIKQAPSIDIFFKFICVLECLLKQNRKRESQVDHYTITTDKEISKKKVQIFGRKKAVSQQLLGKANIKTLSTDDDHFNTLKFGAEIGINFDQAQFYTFRQNPQQKIQFQKQQWKPYINPSFRKPGQQLQLDRIIDYLKYLQDNGIFKYVIERKMKSDSRAYYKINI